MRRLSRSKPNEAEEEGTEDDTAALEARRHLGGENLGPELFF